MYYSNILPVLLVTVLAVSGSPVSPVKKSLTLNQVSQPRVPVDGVLPHYGLAAHAKALAKYGAPQERIVKLKEEANKYGHSPRSRSIRRGIPAAVSSAQNGLTSPPPDNSSAVESTGPLTAVPDWYDGAWLLQMGIGDKTFWVDFDTGSSDLWVFSPEVTGLAPNVTTWSPSATSTQLKNESFYITYGDGSIASGSVWKDQIVLGSVKIPDAVVEIADFATASFEAPSSGIVGLGFDDLNTVSPDKQPTIVTQLYDQGFISSPIVSADLKHQAAGCYTLGDTPWWQYSGAITYSPVDNSQGYWIIQPVGFGIGSNSSSLNTSSEALPLLTGVIDTGTTLMIIDDRLASLYYASVKSADLSVGIGGWVFDCGEVLPDFKLLVGETGFHTYTVVVPGSFLNFLPLGYGNLCYGGIQPTFGQVPFNVWGDVLIKNAFVVFDKGVEDQGPRIGFASKGPY